MRKTRYLTRVIDRFHGGWLKVRLGNEDEALIPYSTKVEMIRVAENYEVVKVLEGKMVNLNLEVPFLNKLGKNTYSYFTDSNIKFSKLLIRIDKKTGILFVNDEKYRIKLSENFDEGEYHVGFPIRKKMTNKNYSDEMRGGSRFYDSWFPIFRKSEFNLSRFLHYGSYSEGCITVSHYENEGKSWSQIFFELMHSRINNGCLALINVG